MIATRTIEQFYDPVKGILPDCYIKGECPTCHSKDQHGDACEVRSSSPFTQKFVSAFALTKPVDDVARSCNN